MAAELGIGVRVKIGWCPGDRVAGDDARLRRGTVTDGPFPAGENLFFGNEVWLTTHTTWEVVVVGTGLARVAEHLLTPDGGDDEEDRLTEERREREMA